MVKPVSTSESPRLRGKTVAVYSRGRPETPVILSDCLMETRGERLFIVGVGIAGQRKAKEWTDGVRRSVAWDAVEEYLLFESPEDYYTHMDAAPPAAGMAGMPMFEMPQNEEGNPVEPSGIRFEPETPLEVGAIVLSYSQERWWRAEVVAIEDDDMVRLHYPGWDSKWDVSVPKNELQVYLGNSLEAD